jgi:hypothetical protein
MSKGNTLETDFLSYTFTGTTFSWDGNVSLYMALHTADPGEAGDQTTSEATYASYARKAVDRDAGAWTVTGGSVTNDSLLQFVAASGGSNIITHFSIGTAASGAGQILYSGALTSSLAVTNGIQPQFAAGAIVFTED